MTQAAETHKIDNKLNQAFHIEKIGNQLEEMENMIRSTMEEIYIKKSKEV